MNEKYQYRFVRLGEGWFFGAGAEAEEEYQSVVHQYARDGWRLVQVFAPGTGPHGRAKYYELIFEREVEA